LRDKEFIRKYILSIFLLIGFIASLGFTFLSFDEDILLLTFIRFFLYIICTLVISSIIIVIIKKKTVSIYKNIFIICLSAILLFNCGIVILEPNNKVIIDEAWREENKSNKVVYIDTRGRTVISFPDTADYYGISDISDDIIIIRMKNTLRTGCINIKGDVLVEPKYNNLYTTAKDGIIGFSNKTETQGLSMYDIYNYNGKLLFSKELKNLDDYSCGFAKVVFKDGQTTFMNKKGDYVFGKFDSAKSFSENLAAVKIDNKRGYIDIKGNLVIDYFDYSGVRSFKNGYAMIKTNDSIGFIDNTGKIVADPIFKRCLDFSEGLAYVEIGSIKDIIENGDLSMEDIMGVLSKAMNFLSNDEKKENNDSEGIGFDFSSIFGLFDSIKGYINENGELVITHEYDSSRSFKDGLACVKIEDKYGFINKSGEIVIPAIYNSCEDFSNGLSLVSVSDNSETSSNISYMYINKRGKQVIGPIENVNASSFSNGYARIEFLEDK
jgi:hypothetical protein